MPRLPRAQREALARRFSSRTIRRATEMRAFLESAEIEASETNDELSNQLVNVHFWKLQGREISMIRSMMRWGVGIFWGNLLICILIFGFLKNWESVDTFDFQSRLAPMIPGWIEISMLSVGLIGLVMAEGLLIMKLRKPEISGVFSIIFSMLCGFLSRAVTIMDWLVLVLFAHTDQTLFLAGCLVMFGSCFASGFLVQLRSIIALSVNHRHRSTPHNTSSETLLTGSSIDFFGWDSPERFFVVAPAVPPFDWSGDPVAAESVFGVQFVASESQRDAIQPGAAASTSAPPLLITQLTQSAGICDFLGLRKVLIDSYITFPQKEVVVFSSVHGNFLRCFTVDLLLIPLKIFFLSDAGLNWLVWFSLWLSVLQILAMCTLVHSQDNVDSVNMGDSVDNQSQEERV